MQAAYITHIGPIVEYASTVWDLGNNHNTKKWKWLSNSVPSATDNFDSNRSGSSLTDTLNWPTLEKNSSNQVDFHWPSFLMQNSSCIRGYNCQMFVPFH